MQPHLPAPFACGLCGALAGLFAGGFTQCFPIWVGAATGGGVGCIICACQCFLLDIPMAQVATTQPVVVQNIYLTYEVTGAPKS
jgi:hypothetical protein